MSGPRVYICCGLASATGGQGHDVRCRNTPLAEAIRLLEQWRDGQGTYTREDTDRFIDRMERMERPERPRLFAEDDD